MTSLSNTTGAPQPAPASDSLEAAQIWARLHPKAYLKQFLDQKTRIDGRAFNASRPFRASFGSIHTCDSSAIVQIGSTSVIVSIKAEVGAPLHAEPKNGMLVIDCHLLPGASPNNPNFTFGAASSYSISISEQIHQLLIQSGCIDLTTLCIEEGQAVWYLYIDVSLLSFDGNIYDAATLGVTQALDSLSLPVTVKDPTNPKGQLLIDRNVPAIPIKLRMHMMSLSFALIGTTVVCDPTADEGSAADTLLHITVDDRGRLVDVWKEAGMWMDKAEIQTAIKLALEKAKQITSSHSWRTKSQSASMTDSQ